MINTVCMDLDGTLLPFEQEEFIKVYFSLLCREMAPFGYAADDVIKAVWSGTKAMMENDGSLLNRDVFWNVFAACLGDEVRQIEATLDAFYTGTFDQVRQVLRGESGARALVDTLKAKGYTVVLATNPLFPEVAQLTRLSWVGLTKDDFAHITHYGNSRFCKPNPLYYREILDTIGKEPDECLMIGNHIVEDMVAAKAGLSTYLITDYLENPDGLSVDAYPHGTLADFAAYADTLPPV